MDQEHRSLVTLALPLMAAALLAGCPASLRRPPTSDAPNTQTSTPPVRSVPAPLEPPPRAAAPQRENRLSPATGALVAQAKSLLNKGDLDAASSTLDRALRIEPNNPLLWIERGRLRLAESDARQAESCGRKALVLASGDRASQKQAGRLLADALRIQQRMADATDVESRPYMH